MLLGELVQSKKLNKTGFVLKVHIKFDATILPLRQVVVRNLDGNRVDFVQVRYKMLDGFLL